MKKAKFYYNNPNAPKPNKPNHMGTSAIIVHKNKILMEYRSDSDYWLLISGGLNIDESIEECALREIQEETGIIINNKYLKFFNIYSNPSRIIEYPDGNIIRCITVTFIINLDFEPNLIISDESRKLEYFDLSEIQEINIVETHRHIIKDYIDSLDSC